MTVKLSFPSKRCIVNWIYIQLCDFHNNVKEFHFKILRNDVDQLIQLVVRFAVKWYIQRQTQRRQSDRILFLFSLARETIAIFGSIYVCVQTFSHMKLVKSNFHSRLIDVCLYDMLRTQYFRYVTRIRRNNKWKANTPFSLKSHYTGCKSSGAGVKLTKFLVY